MSAYGLVSTIAMKTLTNRAAGHACRPCCDTTAAALAGRPSVTFR
jgi:hypothetical protein